MLNTGNGDKDLERHIHMAFKPLQVAQGPSSEVSRLRGEEDCILGYSVPIYSSDMGELSKGE